MPGRQEQGGASPRTGSREALIEVLGDVALCTDGAGDALDKALARNLALVVLVVASLVGTVCPLGRLALVARALPDSLWCLLVEQVRVVALAGRREGRAEGGGVVLAVCGLERVEEGRVGLGHLLVGDPRGGLVCVGRHAGLSLPSERARAGSSSELRRLDSIARSPQSRVGPMTSARASLDRIAAGPAPGLP